MNVPITRTILITGATGAIGGALAKEFAAPGVRLILHGRNSIQLETIGRQCERSGAMVERVLLDVRDIKRLREWVQDLARDTPLDLVIANAGINIDIGVNGRGESWEDTDALLTTNVRSTMALIDAALPGMRTRRSGQIAIISSLAAYCGLPVIPSYCASKAALKAYGEALRGWLVREGIRVNVVMPGYVESRMCRAMPGPKPFLLSPEQAARLIRRGLERDKAHITFPFPLNLGTLILSLLPAPISQRVLRWAGYGI